MWTKSAPSELAFDEVLSTTGRTSVASCDGDPSVAYAVAAEGRADPPGAKVPKYGTVAGAWRSPDGGQSWDPIATPEVGTQGNDWNNCLAVHPTDPEVVALGWRSGPFLWNPQAMGWDRRTDEPGGHMHADVHTLVFATTPEGVDLWAGTDGGVCVSHDLGVTWDSRYNRHLRTAQVYSTLAHTLEEYGIRDGVSYERDNSSFHVSGNVPDLFGIATQDNGTLITRESPAGHRSLWPCNGGDGQAVLFLGDDLVIHTDNTANRLRISRRLATGVIDDGYVVPVDSDAAGLPKLALGATHNPTHRLDGRRVLAVAGGSTAVLVLLEPPAAASQAELRTIANVPQIISAVASLDGSVILVGTIDGHLYSVDVGTGAVTAETLPANAPTGTIKRLRWRGPEHAIGVFGNDQIFRRTNIGWEHLTTAPPSVWDVDGDPEVAGGTLFAALGNGVAASPDLGRTWADCSDGLPVWPNGRAIHVSKAGGEPAVFFATYGWGIFKASLKSDDTVSFPEIDDERARILFGIIQDGDGIEIIGGEIHRVPPRGPARELALAAATAVLASRIGEAAARDITTGAGALARRLARGREA
jgi:hypothetical protein